MMQQTNIFSEVDFVPEPGDVVYNAYRKAKLNDNAMGSCDPFKQGLSADVVVRLLEGKFEKDDLKGYHDSEWFIHLKSFVVKFYKTCVLCNGSKSLTAHHRHYKTLFRESVTEDVVCLCGRCHSKHHGKRH